MNWPCQPRLSKSHHQSADLRRSTPSSSNAIFRDFDVSYLMKYNNLGILMNQTYNFSWACPSFRNSFVNHLRERILCVSSAMAFCIAMTLLIQQPFLLFWWKSEEQLLNVFLLLDLNALMLKAFCFHRQTKSASNLFISRCFGSCFNNLKIEKNCVTQYVWINYLMLKSQYHKILGVLKKDCSI